MQILDLHGLLQSNEETSHSMTLMGDICHEQWVVGQSSIWQVGAVNQKHESDWIYGLETTTRKQQY